MVDASNTCSTSGSSSVTERPVVVRVKRKASSSPVEAFWLEINERPSKRLLLDLEKLTLSGSHDKEELKNKKVFVQHIETVNSSDATLDILQSYVPNSAKPSEIRTKVAERKCLFKEGNKKDQLLSRAKQSHEFLAKNARFEQIQKRRQGKDTKDGDLHEMCHLYDVVRVDNDEDHSNKKEEPKDTSLEDSMLLSNYLPLLREFLPSVAEEIHSDMQSYFTQHHSPQQGSANDGYVYDLYTVQDQMEAADEDPSNAYPLVQVNEEDDFYDGPMHSDYESDDSNAEDNPLNEYPDEETSEDEEDEDESKTSCDESEVEESGSSSYQSDEPQDKRCDVEDEDVLFEEEVRVVTRLPRHYESRWKSKEDCMSSSRSNGISIFVLKHKENICSPYSRKPVEHSMTNLWQQWDLKKRGRNSLNWQSRSTVIVSMQVHLTNYLLWRRLQPVA